MNKFILAVLGIIVVGAVILSQLDNFEIKKSLPNQGSLTAVTKNDVPYIERKDINFTVSGKEYDEGDPDEKFLLAGKDKDLSTKFFSPSMDKIGTIEEDVETRDVYRCHVICNGVIPMCNTGKDLAYIYVLKTPDSVFQAVNNIGAAYAIIASYREPVVMDVYLAEKFYDTLAHDDLQTTTRIENVPDLIPVTDVKIDLTLTIGGQEKNYVIGKAMGSSSPAKQNLLSEFISTYLDTSPVAIDKDIPGLGKLNIYTTRGDTLNNNVYGLDSSITLPDGKSHDFSVFNKIVAAGAGGTTQNVTKNSLQLGYFTFVKHAEVSSTGGNWWTPDCKPAIYLYPKTVSPVSVQVVPKGYLTTTIPEYPTGGWQVIGYPNGKLSHNGSVYPYLYYEAKIEDSAFNKPKEGYVVSSEELSSLYGTLLPKLGLNQGEAVAFKEYWQKALPKSAYYFVGVMDKAQTDTIEPLTISPKPDTIIRVRLYFEALQSKVSVSEPRTIKTPARQGFTVVEWGGMVKMDKDHPYTCSQ